MGKKKTADEKIEKIKRLRMQGYSLPEISYELNIPKTTVFRYSKNVEMFSEVVKTWFGKRGGSVKRKLLKEEKALSEAKKSINNLTAREKTLFVCALYWAEGAKIDFSLSNTDPNLIRVYIQFLKEVFGVKAEMIRASIRIYEDLNSEKCLSFWSNVVGIPKRQFVGVNVLKGKKIGKLEYGMCRIRVVKGGDYLKKIKAINSVIIENLSL